MSHKRALKSQSDVKVIIPQMSFPVTFCKMVQGGSPVWVDGTDESDDDWASTSTGWLEVGTSSGTLTSEAGPEPRAEGLAELGAGTV